MRSLLATIFVLGLSPSSLAAGEKIEAIVGEWIGTGGYEESFSVDSTGQGCYREPESTECVELSFTFLGDNQYGIAEVENIVLELNGNSITGYRDGEIFGTYQRVSSVNTESEFQALFRKAEEGDPDAQFILGEWYETGDRVELNIDAALHWYRLAAEQGHAGAQFKLSIAYRDGLQVERDHFLATQWASKAEQGGYPEAGELHQTLMLQGIGYAIARRFFSNPSP